MEERRSSSQWRKKRNQRKQVLKSRLLNRKMQQKARQTGGMGKGSGVVGLTRPGTPPASL